MNIASRLFVLLGCVISMQVGAASAVSVSDGKFFVNEAEIPSGCFARMMTQLNGDNVVASIFLTRPTLRGCLDANDTYPAGDEEKTEIVGIRQFKDNIYGVTVCEQIDGSMGRHCDSIFVRFVYQNYQTTDGSTNVLVLQKLGEWEL
ncbi:hypothetical protein N8913_04075 [Litoricola sp.]|nr:hypothetical protein [Litorivicinus sp.]